MSRQTGSDAMRDDAKKWSICTRRSCPGGTTTAARIAHGPPQHHIILQLGGKRRQQRFRHTLRQKQSASGRHQRPSVADCHQLQRDAGGRQLCLQCTSSAAVFQQSYGFEPILQWWGTKVVACLCSRSCQGYQLLFNCFLQLLVGCLYVRKLQNTEFPFLGWLAPLHLKAQL